LATVLSEAGNALKNLYFCSLILAPMEHPLRTLQHDAADPIGALQQEIAVLESSIEGIRKEVGVFENQLHSRLDREISRIRELTELYKRQKQEKKAKRLEQKKRGKNWVEPRPLPQRPPARDVSPSAPTKEQQALKRLYREAVVQVHPDKLMQAGGGTDRIARATALTAHLNALYKRGDLEEMLLFWEQIVGNTASLLESGGQQPPIDGALRLETLKRKKEHLVLQLEQLKNSYSYQVLTTYENPLSFIDELYLQFMERIKQLEKRTRSKGSK
jgi:hypothetical protein